MDLPLKELLERNERRVKNEGYSDLSEWLPGMVKYQKQIFEKNLLNKAIDASKPTEKIISEIIQPGT